MTDFPCCEPMTDPGIPDSLVDVGVAGIGTMETQIPSLSTFQAQAVVRAVLTAAIPHLRPPICGDVACPGLGNCEDPDCLPARCQPLLKAATQVALKLGRQEALAVIADEMALSQPEDPCIRYVDVRLDKDTYRQIMAARDTGKGDSA